MREVPPLAQRLVLVRHARPLDHNGLAVPCQALGEVKDQAAELAITGVGIVVSRVHTPQEILVYEERFIDAPNQRVVESRLSRAARTSQEQQRR